MRCNPLTVTGPVPAFSRMVTGAFSSNSPKLTWGKGECWDTSLSRVVHSSTCRRKKSLHCTMGRQLMWRLAMGTEIVFPWWFMAVTSTTLLSSLAPSPRQTCRNHNNVFTWHVPTLLAARAMADSSCNFITNIIIIKLWFNSTGYKMTIQTFL